MSRPEPASLIFDLFGTLVDYGPERTSLALRRGHAASGLSCSYDAYVSAWEAAFQHHEQQSAVSGREFHMFDVAAEVRRNLDAGDVSDTELTRLYLDDWRQGVHEIPGAAGLLRRLGAHYRLALISNTHFAPMVHDIIEGLGVAPLMEVVVTSVEVGIPKPAVKIFRVTLEQLGLDASQAVYIGDSYEADYVGATGAGLDCYLVGSHARVPRDRQLRSIMDLPIYFST